MISRRLTDDQIVEAIKVAMIKADNGVEREHAKTMLEDLAQKAKAGDPDAKKVIRFHRLFLDGCEKAAARRLVRRRR